MKYSENMSAEDQKKLLAEIAAEEAAMAQGAGPMSEEQAHLQELERGYAQDRI